MDFEPGNESDAKYNSTSHKVVSPSVIKGPGVHVCCHPEGLGKNMEEVKSAEFGNR